MLHQTPDLGIERHDALVVFRPPGRLIAARERTAIVHRHRHEERAPRADVPFQAGIRGPAAGQDQHHRPVAAAEDPRERVFVGRTR